jgi:Zn-dependent protease
VPVNTSRLRKPRRDFILVAAAGPASNLALAVIAAVIFRSLTGAGESVSYDALRLLQTVVVINVLLAVFNMVPVPPLDGGNVLAGLLPPRLAYEFSRMAPYGFLILYVLMFSGALSAMITPPAAFLMGLLLR